MADAVLGRIAETDGKITKDKAIDWGKKRDWKPQHIIMTR